MTGIDLDLLVSLEDNRVLGLLPEMKIEERIIQTMFMLENKFGTVFLGCNNAEEKYPSYIMAKKFNGYSEKEIPFLQLHFNQWFIHGRVSRYLTDLGVYSAEDENRNNLCNKICRDYNVTFSSWNLIESYEITKTVDNLIYMNVDIHNVHALDVGKRFFLNKTNCRIIEEYVTANSQRKKEIETKIPMIKERYFPPFLNPLNAKINKMLLCFWDTETYMDRNMTDRTKKICDPNRDGDKLISISFYFAWAEKILTPVCQIVLLNLDQSFDKFSNGLNIAKTEEAYKAFLEEKKKNPALQKFNSLFRKEADPTIKFQIESSDYDIEIIPCANEFELLNQFIDIMQEFRPDLMSGFNDFGFDWVYIITRMKKYSLLCPFVNKVDPIGTCDNVQMAERYSFHTEKFKIMGTEKVEGSYPTIPGMQVCDSMIKMIQIKKATMKHHKLKDFLEADNLGTKDDLDYRRIFYYYEEFMNGTITEYEILRLVHYNMVDSISCAKLWNREGILQKLCYDAYFTYTSLRHSIFYADSVRILSVMTAHLKARGYVITTKGSKKGKDEEEDEEEKKEGGGSFSGGFVLRPQKRGLVQEPVIVGDFASLYPSIIIGYNLSPELIIYEPSVASKLQAEGKYLKNYRIPYKGELQEGWVIRHNGRPDFSMGIYGVIIDELRTARFELKAQMKKLKKARTVLIDKIEKAKEKNEDVHQMELDLAEANFQYESMDMKSTTAKVFMNSIYGISGASFISLFNIIIAGGITTTGVYLIQSVMEFIKKKGYSPKFGDTDSVGSSCPDSIYADIDKTLPYDKYQCAKAKRAQEVFEKFLPELNDYIKSLVNEGLPKEMWSDYLKMELDKVMHPSFFFCKKHYAALNQQDKQFWKIILGDGCNLIEQGTENKKRSGTEMLNNIMRDMEKALFVDVQVEVTYDVMLNIIKEVIKKYASQKITYRSVAKSYCYRVGRDNKTLVAFIDKLQKRGSPIPRDGERFDLVVCLAKDLTTITGGAAHPKVGERLEFLEDAEDNNLPIDGRYYFEHNALNTLARFLAPYIDRKFENYDDPNEKLQKWISEHQMPIIDDVTGQITTPVIDEEDKIEQMEKIQMDIAEKILESVIAPYFPEPDRTQERQVAKTNYNTRLQELFAYCESKNIPIGRLINARGTRSKEIREQSEYRDEIKDFAEEHIEQKIIERINNGEPVTIINEYAERMQRILNLLDTPIAPDELKISETFDSELKKTYWPKVYKKLSKENVTIDTFITEKGSARPKFKEFVNQIARKNSGHSLVKAWRKFPHIRMCQDLKSGVDFNIVIQKYLPIFKDLQEQYEKAIKEKADSYYTQQRGAAASANS